jgi:hypothetical protein
LEINKFPKRFLTMSRLNPSVDNISSTDTLPTDMVGGSTTAGDKYDNSRHLKYGQTERKKSDESRYVFLL